MKKRFLLAVSTAILLLQSNTMPSQNQPVTASPAVEAQRRTTYSWYNDPEFTSFTGSVATINDELSRLRNLYSGYTFSATPGTGLYAFEFGDHPIYSSATIYSNY